MCFYTVTKLKLKTLTVAKLSGQRWVWQRRCFGLEIIIHHCRMSCCSQKHQHRHCRQKRCKRKKENNVENILNIKYIDDLFLLYAFFSFPNKFLPLLLSFIHKKKKKNLGQALWKFYLKRFFFFFASWLYHRTNWKLTFLQVRLSLCDHVVLWWCDVFSSFCLHRCDQQVCAELIYPDLHSQSKHWRLFFFWKMKSISFWYSTWIKSFTS